MNNDTMLNFPNPLNKEWTIGILHFCQFKMLNFEELLQTNLNFQTFYLHFQTV